MRIPRAMQSYTGGEEIVTVAARNVRELIEELEARYPGMRAALMNGDKLKPDVAVVVDGQIARLGLLEPLRDSYEVMFMPAIAGG